MHGKGVFHRDINPDNIFLGLEGKIKLGDFGISRIFDSIKTHTTSIIGTPYYLSPDLLKFKPYSLEADIWAIGCILYELCFLKRAFDGKDTEEIAFKIINKEPNFNNF